MNLIVKPVEIKFRIENQIWLSGDVIQLFQEFFWLYNIFKLFKMSLHEKCSLKAQ